MQSNNCSRQTADSRHAQDSSKRMCCESCCEGRENSTVRQSCCDSCCISDLGQSKSVSLDSISLEFPLSGRYIKTKTKSHSLIHSYVTKNMIKCHKCHPGPKKFMVHNDYSTKTLYKRNNRKRCKKKNRRGTQKDFNNGYKKLYKTDRETIREKYFRLFKEEADCVNTNSNKPTNEVVPDKTEKRHRKEMDTKHLKKLPIPKKTGRKKSNNPPKQTQPEGNRTKKYIICDDTTCGMICGCVVTCGGQRPKYQPDDHDLQRHESDNLHFKKTCYSRNPEEEVRKKSKQKQKKQTQKPETSRRNRRCEWSPNDSLTDGPHDEYTSYYQKAYDDNMQGMATSASNDYAAQHYAAKNEQEGPSRKHHRRKNSVIDVERRGTYIIRKDDNHQDEYGSINRNGRKQYSHQRGRRCRPCNARPQSFLGDFKEEDEDDAELSTEELRRYLSTHEITSDTPVHDPRKYNGHNNSETMGYAREGAAYNGMTSRTGNNANQKPRRPSPVGHDVNYPKIAEKLQRSPGYNNRNSMNNAIYDDEFEGSDDDSDDDSDEDDDSDDDDDDDDDDEYDDDDDEYEEECEEEDEDYDQYEYDDNYSDDDDDDDDDSDDDDDEEISNITYDSPENSELELNTEYYNASNRNRNTSYNKLQRTYTSRTYKKFSHTESFSKANKYNGNLNKRDSINHNAGKYALERGNIGYDEIMSKCRNLNSSDYDSKMMAAKHKSERPRRESRQSTADNAYKDLNNKYRNYSNEEQTSCTKGGNPKKGGRVCQSYYSTVIEEPITEDDCCEDSPTAEDSDCFGTTDKIQSNRTFLIENYNKANTQNTPSENCGYDGPPCDSDSEEEFGCPPIESYRKPKKQNTQNTSPEICGYDGPPCDSDSEEEFGCPPMESYRKPNKQNTQKKSPENCGYDGPPCDSDSEEEFGCPRMESYRKANKQNTQKKSPETCGYDGPPCDSDSSDEEFGCLEDNATVWNKVWKSDVDDGCEDDEGTAEQNRNDTNPCNCGCKCHSNSDECSGTNGGEKAAKKVAKASKSKKPPKVENDYFADRNVMYNPCRYEIYQASSFSVSPPFMENSAAADGNIFITARFVVSDDDLQQFEVPDANRKQRTESTTSNCKCYKCIKRPAQKSPKTPSTDQSRCSFMNDQSTSRTASSNKRLSFLNDSYALSQQKMQPQYSQNRKTKKRDNVRNNSITKK